MTKPRVAKSRLPLGLVTGAFGSDGELRVRWLGDGPENLLEVDVVWIARDDTDPLPRRHNVRAAEVLGGDELRMQLAGLRERSDAEPYKNHLVLVEEDALGPLGDDEFYWHQLIGCGVVSQDGELLGEVTSLWETGSHDVLVVQPTAERLAKRAPDAANAGAPYLIPTAREFVTEIDLDARRIVVELLPGLLED